MCEGEGRRQGLRCAAKQEHGGLVRVGLNAVIAVVMFAVARLPCVWGEGLEIGRLLYTLSVIDQSPV